MSAAFTPAPWTLCLPVMGGDYDPCVLTSDGGDPLEADTLEGGADAARANAHLIAAAPELYELLEWLLGSYDLGVVGAERATALLAKARGKS